MNSITETHAEATESEYPVVSFTLGIATDGKPQSKSHSIGPDGRVVTESPEFACEGTVTRVQCPLDELPNHFTDPNSFMVLGVPKDAEIGKPYLHKTDSAGGDGIARTAANYEWPEVAVGLLDVDIKEDFILPTMQEWSDQDQNLIPDSVLGLVNTALKSVGSNLKGVSLLGRRSASSSIYDEDGNLVKDSKGIHIFLAVRGKTPGELLDFLHKWLVINGRGHCYITSDGRRDIRTIIDKQVGQTNRVSFEAPATLGAGLQQKRGKTIAKAGDNLGWAVREGRRCFPADATCSAAGLVEPFYEYPHKDGDGSVTGGYVYTGSAIPALAGRYVFGDYGATSGVSSGRLMSLQETAPLSGRFLLEQAIPLAQGNPFALRVLTLGEDESGELYVGTKTTAGVLELANGRPAGGVYRLVPVRAGNVTLSPTRDATLFEENGALANGAGAWLFSGVTAGTNSLYHRRALLGFDLSSIPPTARVDSATLRLTMDKTIVGPFPFQLQPLTTPWSEGSSDAGNPGGAGTVAAPADATFTHASFPERLWTNPGGDFLPAASSTTSVDGNNRYAWSGPGLLADVQSWLANPSGNHGWILRDPADTTNRPSRTVSAKRFASRSHPDPAARPSLEIAWTDAPAPSFRESWLAQYFPDLLPGAPANDREDADGDGLPNVLEYAFGTNPRSRDHSNPFAPVASGPDLRFSRDARPGDLRWQLESSTNLLQWSPAGPPVLPGGTFPPGPLADGIEVVSDSPNEASPLRTVTLRITPSPTRFLRLAITRF